MGKKYGGHGWFIWNLANILSFCRMMAPFLLFGTDFDSRMKLILLVGLASTDIFDGAIARLVGNSDGVGKIIDSTADKVMIFSGLLFLYHEKMVPDVIIGAILVGELFVFIIAYYGAYLAFKATLSRMLSKSSTIRVGEYYSLAKAEVLRNWKVNVPGKITVIFYFLMAGFIFLDIVLVKNDMFEYLYEVSFVGGISARVISIGMYLAEMSRLQKEKAS